MHRCFDPYFVKWKITYFLPDFWLRPADHAPPHWRRLLLLSPSPPTRPRPLPERRRRSPCCLYVPAQGDAARWLIIDVRMRSNSPNMDHSTDHSAGHADIQTTFRGRVRRLLRPKSTEAQATPVIRSLRPMPQLTRGSQLQQRLVQHLAGAPVDQLLTALDMFCAPATSRRPTALTPRHVILILGVQVQLEGRPNPRLELRVQNAYRLAGIYPQAPLVVSGAYVKGPFDTPSVTPIDPDQLVEANAMRLRLQELGVPAERIYTETRAQHTVGNFAHGYAKIEDKLLPILGQVDHITLSMEPYHAPRAARIAAAMAHTLPKPPTLHVSMSERLGPHLPQGVDVYTKRRPVLLCLEPEAIANLTRCQREKVILAHGW